MNRDGFWFGQRVLVLGCSGFLGTWLVRSLLQRGAGVVGLIRNSQRHSELFEQRIHEQIRVVRGTASPDRLRSLLSVHEFSAVFQLATQWEAPSTKTTITADLLHTIAEVSPDVSMIVPIAPNESEPRFQNGATTKLRVGFVKLPELWGEGQSRQSTWTARAFVAASQQRLVPAPPNPNQPILDAETAATYLVEAGKELIGSEQPPEFGLQTAAQTDFTARELYERLTKPMEAPADELGSMIRQTLNWYQQHPVLLGTEAPRSRAA